MILTNLLLRCHRHNCATFCRSGCHSVLSSSSSISQKSLLGLVKYRQLWGFLNAVFNKVDESRILEVGPDRACAEWLLRCGASVKWVNSLHFLKDYNSLPATGGSKLYKISEINATDSAIMHIGFPHFKNCQHIRYIIFHKAIYLDDEALSLLQLLKNSLEQLQISSCGMISADGLYHLKELKNLKELLLFDLPLIKDKKPVVESLSSSLPQCKISFPYAQASEILE